MKNSIHIEKADLLGGARLPRALFSAALLVFCWFPGCSDEDNTGDPGSEPGDSAGAPDSGQKVDAGATNASTLSAIPFDYLDCSEVTGATSSPPEGGTVVTSGSLNAWGASDSGLEVTITNEAVVGQIFDSAKRVKVDGTPENPWNVQVQESNAVPIAEGDVLLATLWVRCEKSLLESGECQLLFIIEDNESYEKVVQYPVYAGKDWQLFQIPVTSTQAYDENRANISLFAGYPDQTVEVGTITVVNYGTSQIESSLPKSAVTYPGMTPDAPWREAAASRIDVVRRGEMAIQVADANGGPIKDAEIQVNMTRHAFWWGSAISSGIIAEGESPEDYERYTEEIVDLFNLVTAYNAFKWKPLAGDWGSGWDEDRATNTLDWALEQGLDFRGHVVLWPGWSHMPEPLQDLADDPSGLRSQIDQRIAHAMGMGKQKMVQWDIVNEPYDNRDLMDIMGDEEMIAWFEAAHEADPDVALYLNDYTILSGGPGNTGHRDNFEYWINLLDNAGAPLHGLGMQSHFGLSLTGPEAVYELLERFGSTYNKEVAITEYDIRVDDENLAGCFTHDFMTAIFSHEKVNSFVMWGFKGEEDPIYDEEWNLKTAGQVYKDLVFDRWWTRGTLTSNDQGQVRLRGFYGDYEVTVTKGKDSKRVNASHTSASPLSLTIEI